MKNNQNEYTTLSLVGSLFSADMLSLMAQGNSSHQSTEDYKLLPGLRFSDEISRSFNIARAFYNEYKKNRNESAAYDTTKKFIEDFFTKALNYDSFITSSGKTIKDRKYPVTHYAAKDVPIIIAPYTFSLDELDARFTVEGVTSRKKSAFSLAQLFLNASNDCTWAFATNGLELRLLRDSDSLVRPSFLSFDIESILNDSRYPDFVALWYLIHSSRVNVWEAWRQEGITNGTRVREGLRDGVTNALLHLGAGFLQTEGDGNNALLNALKDGKRADGVSYTQMDFYKALLREVYRFLFLSTIEERNLLFSHTGDEAQLTPELRKAHRIYREGYSIHRLAEKSRRILSNDKYSDIWHGVQVVFKALQKGNEALDLSPLGGLFRADQCPLLDACNIDNEHLLKAIRCLRWCYINGKLTFTDYRNMGTEEFGSVYESLLELVPRVDLTAKSFSFVGIGDENGIDEEGSTTGNARKTSGSYYTNAELVNSLIKSALEPGLIGKIERAEMIAKKRNEEMDYEKTILSFSVVDPACGSGHFLLAAARRIAEVLVEKQLEKMSDEVPSQALYRKALRDVITNCIYGVDLNEMAVELTRTALWLEGYEPGKPLEFLSHHIKCGNSLVGVYDLDILNHGIPDIAYTCLSGDEKETCFSMLKSNKSDILNKGQQSLFASDLSTTSGELAALMWKIDSIPNDTIEDQERKSILYDELLQNKDYLKSKTACDLYVSAFFAEKTSDNYDSIPRSIDIFDVQNDMGESIGRNGIRDVAESISKSHKFLHWKIEFPEIFKRDLGFDCILGNPPWDRVKLQEKEWFAQRVPEIAEAPNKSIRDKKIAALKKGTPLEQAIYNDFMAAHHDAEAVSNFVHGKDYPDCRFPLTGVGDVNLYPLFSELFLNLRSAFGTAGFVVPSGIASDAGTKDYFEKISTGGMLKSLYDFENREGLFPTVDSRYKFCLVTLAPKEGASDFAFFITNMHQLEDERRHFTMDADEFDLLNPNTHTCPVFRSKKDAELTKKMYKKSGVLLKETDKENGDPWKVELKTTLYHMANDSSLFSMEPGKDYKGRPLLPLYEAKMMHQFDHRWNTFVAFDAPQPVSDEDKSDINFEVKPEYWVQPTETTLRLTNLSSNLVTCLRNALGTTDNSSENQKLLMACYESNNEDIKQLMSSDLKNKNLAEEVYKIADKHAPNYIMMWRKITNVTNQRTVIATVLPRYGLGDSGILFSTPFKPTLNACFIANLNSLIFDYQARQKLGGINLSLWYMKQFPVISPKTYTEKDIKFIVSRVFALTYTTYSMQDWAKDLWDSSSLETRLEILHKSVKDTNAITDTKFVNRAFDSNFIPPISFNVDERLQMKCEIDAYFSKLYGLNREDVRYILDPSVVMGEDYPSVTFPGLKDAEIREYGEYRTQRLVLEAWDKME